MKTLNIVDTHRRIPTQRILNLAWIHRYSFLRYDMTQESNLFQPKHALAQLDIQPMISKLLQNQTEIFFVFFFTLRVDQYIIDEHHDKLLQILPEDLVHQIHKVGWCIIQSKIHHRILSDLQLMISRSKINLREHARPSELIE
jgi:hypothetical protein